MSNINLEWQKNDGVTSIYSEGIQSIIEVDEQNKQLKNVKKFFREILFNYYYNSLDMEIKLIENDTIAIPEVKTIISSLIDTCNEKLNEIKHKED